MDMNRIKAAMLYQGIVLGAAACGSGTTSAAPEGGDPAQVEQQVVEIFSWWIAPGEAEALQALVDVNREQHPNDRIFNAAAESGADARARLAERLAAGDPPDLFQQNAHAIGAFVAENPNSLEPLDSLFVEHGFDGAMSADIIESVTVDGAIYAMPVNIHRENGLFYNKQIFADHDLTPPATLSDFLDVCETLKAAGVTPISTSFQGWIQRILFNSIAQGSMGAAAYYDYMTGGPRDDAALQTAIGVFGDVLDNYINAEAGEADFGWTQAAEAVFEGEAAMFLHGDWAKGYYVQLGWTPGVDFGVVGAPGASDLFWYGVDVFSLPAGAPHVAGAENFLQAIGSLEGQVAFNRLKGSTPVRPDVPREELDSEGRTTLDDFENASYRILVVNRDEWDQAMSAFALDRDADALLQAYVDFPPGG